jgi:hypothetical protein
MISTTFPQISTSSSFQKSYNYPIYQEQLLPTKASDKQRTQPSNEPTKLDIFESIHSMWSFFKSSTKLSAERIIPEQQKVIKIREEVLSTYYTFEFQSSYVESMYSLQETEKIQKFLEMNQFLVPLLYTAFFQIKKYFPDAVVLLNFDQEYEDDQQLMATIITNKSPDEAFQRLQQLDEQWWLEALDDAKMKLSINLEFK